AADVPIAGLVLAGGSGRRLGRSKATVVVRGRTLVERAVDLVAARCQPVVVVSRPDVPLPSLGVPVVLDRAGVRGPMNALLTGLTHLDTHDVIVLACDLPFAGPLLDRLAAAPAGRAVAAADERLQPLCARYPRLATIDACERLMARGVRRMTSLLADLDAATIPAEEGELFNLNTADDLEQARLRSPAG
ncbi:MAG TPA: molybdenum cofactor guanylyltransferase, partial [Acidimicrobiales bacterium]|nr:molybdenum cofactor guanylyltransferase [Acidimicrobiales bacterium]